MSLQVRYSYLRIPGLFDPDYQKEVKTSTIIEIKENNDRKAEVEEEKKKESRNLFAYLPGFISRKELRGYGREGNLDRGKVLGLVFADLKTCFTISPQSITEKKGGFQIQYKNYLWKDR
tara:strand:- start:1475 stop:1831 length:357 start_codon:yes stop_codon:yes gene_type:complete